MTKSIEQRFEQCRLFSSDPGASPEATAGQETPAPVVDVPGTLGSETHVAPPDGLDPARSDNDLQVVPRQARGVAQQAPTTDDSFQLIPVTAVAIPEGRRPVKRKWLPGLIRSIESEGLYVPITVRASGKAGKPYELVAGRHRLEACRELGWSEIAARVVDLNDEMADMAAIAENLWCLPLRKAQFERALAKWEALYQARYPETVQHRAGGVAKARKTRAAARGAAKAVGRGAAANAEEQGDGSRCFAQTVADRLGTSRRTAERALKRSRIFSDEDREDFQQCHVTITQQDAIATIADREQRDKCISDIIHGLDPFEAVARYKAHSNAATDVMTEAERIEAKMTDTEWLETVCGEIRRRLKDPKVYDADALLYRKIDKARRQLKAQVQELLERIEPDQRGLFAREMWKLCHIAHPKDWRVCDACGGAGAGPDGSRCRKCFFVGSGYLFKYERGQ